MNELTSEDEAKLLLFLKQKTGASSFVLIYCDSPLPCPEIKDKKDGESCGHKHEIRFTATNISEDHLVDFLRGVQDIFIRTKTGAIPSPFTNNV